MNGLQPLPWSALAGAAALQLAVGACSAWLSVGLERALAVAVLRMVLQLTLVGQLLGWLLSLNHPASTALWGLGMCALAAHTAVGRTRLRPTGIGLSTFAALAVSSASTVLFATQVLIEVDPERDAQTVIVVLGMLLGNALTALSLCLERLLGGLQRERAAVEMALCLGATGWEAARPAVRDALRAALVPTLNSMAVAGLVTLPGMMTGQILAGIPPAQAVRYQILIFLLIAFSTSAACGLVVLWVLRRAFDPDLRLRELAAPEPTPRDPASRRPPGRRPTRR